MQRQVELYHDPSDAAKFNLVAELMSCSWASGFGCRFFLCVLSVMTAIFTVLYVEGSRPLELDGQAESEASASNTPIFDFPIFDLDERRYEGSAESIVNSVISTSMKAQGELRNLESNIRLEHTLQRLTHVLYELDEQLEGRELSTLDDDPYARLVDQNAEGLFRVSGSSGAEDTGVHARSLVVEPPHDELTLDTSVTTTTTDDSQVQSALHHAATTLTLSPSGLVPSPDNIGLSEEHVFSVREQALQMHADGFSGLVPENLPSGSPNAENPKLPVEGPKHRPQANATEAGVPQGETSIPGFSGLGPVRLPSGSLDVDQSIASTRTEDLLDAFVQQHVPFRFRVAVDALIQRLPRRLERSSELVSTGVSTPVNVEADARARTIKAPSPEPRNLGTYYRRTQDKNMHRSKPDSDRKSRRKEARRLKSSQRNGKQYFSIAKLVVWLCLVFSVAVLVFMNPGFHRGHNPGGNHPRQHAHVGDAGPPYVGTATLKVPPAWSCERNHHYSLRSWISDLVLWASATDVEAARQGAIAAMQITGSAKELVREIPPEHLAQGAWDQQTGQHITGLMLLVTTLARRYSPLDGEAQTRAVSDFLNFNRLPGESIDAFLVRFDVLRNRAAVRGGLGVNHQGLAWLLLKAVGVSVDQLDRLLQPLNGNLPQDEAQLAQLLERIRRQGHLFEGSYRHPNQQAGVGDPGAYNYFPTFGVPRDHAAHDVPADLSGGLGGSFGGPGSWMPDHSSAGGAAEDMGQYVAGPGAGSSADGEERCTACGSYFDDWEFSSATDTDTGSVDEGIRAYNAVEVDGESRTDANSRQNELYQDYILARRRWRRYTGKPPRRYRRVNFRANRHIGKLRNGPYGRTYAAFLPPTAFAGGKGAGKTKGGFHRKNPRGKDGQVLKCSKCGSEEHLWRKCPQVISKGAGKGQGLGQSSAHLADFSRPVPASLALTSPPAPPRVETWHTGVASAALPGVAFHYHVGSQGAASSVASHASGNRYMTTLEEDLARLESVSQVSSNRSRKSRRSDVGPDSPPRWSAAETARSVAESAEAQDADNTAVEALRPGAPSPKHPPPNRRGPNADEIERNRTVVQLNSLLMAWWEADEEGSTYDTAPTGDTNNAKAYHLRTRLANDRPGLLIDPGAA